MADSDLRATLQSTIDTFLDNNTRAVRQQDPSLLSAALTADCLHLLRPRSFVHRYPQFIKPQLTNAEYEAQKAVEFRTMKDVHQKVTRTVIDTDARAAVVWVEMSISTAAEVGGDGQGVVVVVEVLWDLSFTEDGKKVRQVLEFVDTYESSKMLEGMMRDAAGATEAA
jgi:hypothetical protein